WNPRLVCHKECNCMSDNKRRHNDTALRRPPNGREGRRFRRKELYKVPKTLISDMHVYNQSQ
ncbi:MAG: hypothetical protein ACKPKO_19840, partial [Candidatus Fonsibacter sp.]